jgi:predicted DNA-binding protein (MmcQ/YjbR family)
MPDPVTDARRAVVAFALSLPGAWEDHPWGETVAKVGKKVFAFLGCERPDGSLLVCVKLPTSGPAALETAFVEPAGYGLGKSGWVYAKFEAGDRPPTPLLLSWVEESYRAVAPKALVKQRDAAAGGAPAAPQPAGRPAARAKTPAPARSRAKKSPAARTSTGRQGRAAPRRKKTR